MPRVRLTARGCSALAVLAAGVCTAAAALAAPPAGGTPVRPAETDARRRDEVEAAQRQDIAESLKKHFNIDVDWRTMPLEKLVDVRVRAAKAAELQQRLGVSVDWQRYSWIELEALRRTLINFERYRGEHTGAAATPVAVAAAPASPRPAPDDDGVLPPTFKGRPLAKAGRATEPDGVIRPTFTGRPAAPG
jgi:hypothetical protein